MCARAILVDAGNQVTPSARSIRYGPSRGTLSTAQIFIDTHRLGWARADEFKAAACARRPPQKGQVHAGREASTKDGDLLCVRRALYNVLEPLLNSFLVDKTIYPVLDNLTRDGQTFMDHAPVGLTLVLDQHVVPHDRLACGRVRHMICRVRHMICQ